MSELNWERAEKYLNDLIQGYEEIGACGMFGLILTLYPLRQRYEQSERTQELYDAIMGCK